MTSVLIDVKKEMHHLADPSIASHSMRFFKTGPGEYGEGDVFRGIRVPKIRQMSRKYRDISLEDTLSLLKSTYHEDRQLSLFILVLKYQKGDQLLRNTIFRQYLSHTKYINSWDLVDGSAPHIIGAHLISKDRAMLDTLAGSKSLWERRIAILATMAFIRRNSFDDTIRLAERLLRDPEDLIHKAVGWMLREIGKRSLKTEDAFLSRFYQTMPRTMLRYAIEKLPEPLRQAYLSGTRTSFEMVGLESDIQ